MHPLRFTCGAGMLAAVALASTAFGQTTVALTGGDAGEGLTLDPAKVLFAYNLNGSSDVTVQGVTFTSLSLGHPDFSAVSGNPFAGDQVSTDDNGLKTVIQTLAWDGGGTYPTTITFNGLAADTNYHLDVMYYSGNYGGREQAIVVNSSLVDIVTVSQTTAYNTGFVASSNSSGSLTLTVVQSGGYGGTGHQDGSVVNAVVLSSVAAAVPEPATVALWAGVLGLGAVAYRRRRS